MFLHHASQREKKTTCKHWLVVIITSFKETSMEIRNQIKSERITICWDKFGCELVNYHKNTIYTMISIRVSESQIQEHSKLLFTFSCISILLYNQIFFSLPISFFTFFSRFLSLSLAFLLEIGSLTRNRKIFKINPKSISVCRNISNNSSRAEKQLAQQRLDCTGFCSSTKIQAL